MNDITWPIIPLSIIKGNESSACTWSSLIRCEERESREQRGFNSSKLITLGSPSNVLLTGGKACTEISTNYQITCGFKGLLCLLLIYSVNYLAIWAGYKWWGQNDILKCRTAAVQKCLNWSNMGFVCFLSTDIDLLVLVKMFMLYLLVWLT